MNKIRLWYIGKLEDCKKDVEFLRGKYKEYGVRFLEKELISGLICQMHQRITWKKSL